MRERRAKLLAERERDALLDEVGAALDALRLAAVARGVFPDLSENHDKWEVARAILDDEVEMRKIVVEGVRAHGEGDGPVYARCLDRTLKQIARRQAPWTDRTQELWDRCSAVADKDEVAELYQVVAVSDARAQKVLTLPPGRAKAYLGDLHRRIDLLRDLEAREKG